MAKAPVYVTKKELNDFMKEVKELIRNNAKILQNKLNTITKKNPAKKKSVKKEKQTAL